MKLRKPIWNYLVLCLTLAFALSLVDSRQSVALEQPNIVLIVADDLGYSDLGCYGSEIRTPNLDRLAANGLKFSQFYNATRCCPSRACLLTGRYPHQAGIGHMTYDAGEPGYRGELRNDIPTVAERLKAAGYFTAMTGKWHVTPNTTPDSDRDNWPCNVALPNLWDTAGARFVLESGRTHAQ